MKRLILIIPLVLWSCSTSIKGTGTSKSIGTVKDGALLNGRRFPKKGPNYKYFSSLSFALFNRAWVHEKVLETTLAAYKALESKYPKNRFLLMECSKEHGGKMWPHRTHQNGTSIDFGVPLLKNGKPYHFDQHFGIFHYLMAFDENGRYTMNKKVHIDFETLGYHILVLEEEARKRGLYIKKVILKINLKDNLFATAPGKIIKQKGNLLICI